VTLAVHRALNGTTLEPALNFLRFDMNTAHGLDWPSSHFSRARRDRPSHACSHCETYWSHSKRSLVRGAPPNTPLHRTWRHSPART